MLTLLAKGVQTKPLKLLWLKIFPFAPVSTTAVVHLELQISPQIGEKSVTKSYRILRGLGETDSCKNLKSKISWLCPFKVIMRGVDKKFQNQSRASLAVESC